MLRDAETQIRLQGADEELRGDEYIFKTDWEDDTT